MVPASAPVFSAGHADEQHLFESAKAIVQHHWGPVMGALWHAVDSAPTFTHSSYIK